MSGVNSRRIRKALKPLLGEEHLSKSAVSRVVSRLKERFEEWQNRTLSEEVYAIVYLDGFHMKVRMAQRREWPSNNDGVARSGFGTLRGPPEYIAIRHVYFTLGSCGEYSI